MPSRANWKTQPGIHFVDGAPEPQNGQPKAGDAPPSPSPGGAPGAADPARVEREARLEADAQSYRSLKGRLKEAGLDKLKPEELAELVSKGRAASEGTPPNPDGNDADPEGGHARKTKEMLVSEHQEAIKRERLRGEEKLSQTTKALTVERDHYKGLYTAGLVDRETDVILSEEAFEDFDRANVRDALKSDRVPFRLALDEEAGALMVLDKKTGSEYKDPETRTYLTPREALAALPRFASYVKRVTLPGGTGPTSTTPGPTQRGKTDPNKLSSLGKIGMAFPNRS
jgi:hypothetical protein